MHATNWNGKSGLLAFLANPYIAKTAPLMHKKEISTEIQTTIRERNP